MSPAKPIPYRIIRMGLAQEPESPDASLVAPMYLRKAHSWLHKN